MKKLVLVMALLLAVPAMAVVNFSGVVDPVAGTITLKYAGEPTELPRGFALKLTVTSGDAKINGWSGSSFFDVFIDYAYSAGAGYTKGAGHPFANPAAPGPLDVSAGVTLTSLCMGYLDEDGDVTKGEPGAQTGDLIVLKYTNTTESVLKVEADTLRGPASGVVGSTLASNLPINITIGAIGCWNGDAASKVEWQSVGSPQCWCASVRPRQCHGDADGLSQGKNKYWVSTLDLDVLTAAWNKPYADIAGKQVNGVDLICADFNHTSQGKQKYRVSTLDLDIMTANWNKANLPNPDCADVLGSQEPL